MYVSLSYKLKNLCGIRFMCIITLCVEVINVYRIVWSENLNVRDHFYQLQGVDQGKQKFCKT